MIGMGVRPCMARGPSRDRAAHSVDLILHAPLAAAWKRKSDSGVMPRSVQGSQVGTLFVQGDPDVPPVRSIFIAHERIT